MKLWYQSMTRQAEWGGYPAVLRGILDKVKDKDTEIHVAGINRSIRLRAKFHAESFAENTITNPERTKNISTPTQPAQANDANSGETPTAPLILSGTPFAGAQDQNPR